MTLKTEVCRHVLTGRCQTAIDFLATFGYNKKVIEAKDKSRILDCGNTLWLMIGMSSNYFISVSSIEDLANKCIKGGYEATEDSVQQFVSDSHIIKLIVAWMGDYCHE
jgi:hypothetical protein